MTKLPPKPKSPLLTTIVGGVAITATLLTGCSESSTPTDGGTVMDSAGIQYDAGIHDVGTYDVGSDAGTYDVGSDAGPSVGLPVPDAGVDGGREPDAEVDIGVPAPDAG